MQRELLAEAATRQDHSSLQIRVVGGSPGTVSIQTAGRRKSLVGPSLCPGIMPGSPVGWWKGSSKLTLRHWWPVGAFLGFLKQLQLLLVKTSCAQHLTSSSSPLLPWSGGTWPTSSLWYEGPTRTAPPSHLSFQAVSHSAKNLSAASLHNAFVTRPSKWVRGFCCAKGSTFPTALQNTSIMSTAAVKALKKQQRSMVRRAVLGAVGVN